MDDQGKQLSNPFSTGGGGPNFENQVQTAFVALMLTGGVVPCLRPWPIKKIKLQGKFAGYNTDDFIAFVEDQSGGQQARLLAQIKHVVSITEGDKIFGEVLQAAWLDYNNPECFDPKCDAIALISGPLSAVDVENSRTILDWARTSENAQEFLTNVNRTNFSSGAKIEKLNAFRSQLRKANKDQELTDEQLWQFLKCFHLLGYDLDRRSGVALSLLHSHIGQFTNDTPGLWAVIAREVASFNQNAGTITLDALSTEIIEAFSERRRRETIPADLLKGPTKAPEPSHSYPVGENAEALMFATLVGSWNDKNKADLDAIEKVIKSHD